MNQNAYAHLHPLTGWSVICRSCGRTLHVHPTGSHRNDEREAKRIRSRHNGGSHEED